MNTVYSIFCQSGSNSCPGCRPCIKNKPHVRLHFWTCLWAMPTHYTDRASPLMEPSVRLPETLYSQSDSTFEAICGAPLDTIQPERLHFWSHLRTPCTHYSATATPLLKPYVGPLCPLYSESNTTFEAMCALPIPTIQPERHSMNIILMDSRVLPGGPIRVLSNHQGPHTRSKQHP